MKSFIISILCIAAILIAGLLFIRHSDRVVEELSAQAETSLYSCISREDWDASDQSFHDLQESWKKHKIMYLIFSDHAQPYDIDITFNRIEAYLHAKSRDQAMGEVMALKQQFLLLKQSESLSLGNII